jgi:FkbM family methyltransferase
MPVAGEAEKKTAYAALEVATHRRGVARVINGERIRFPARRARYYGAEYEAATVAWMRQSIQPGGVALDIGAHIGLMSVQLARCVGRSGRVFSFERTSGTRQVLQRVLRFNHVAARVEVRSEAVSDHEGHATFFDTGNAVSAANTLVNAADANGSGARTGSYQVPLTSVDIFCRSRGLHPTFVKIDAEGVELDVLRGAREVFLKCRPHAHLALHPASIERNGQSLEQIWELLEEYRLSVLRAPQNSPSTPRGRRSRGKKFRVGVRGGAGLV